MRWRCASISPIFKKGHRTLRFNYRPIFLTSVISKILERIIRDELLGHLIENRLINKAQHGFVPSKSCLSNLLETLDFITSSLVDGNSVDEILLDFAKAFDLVPHHKLVHKIKGYGVTDEMARWFEDFLSFRRQRVTIGNASS